MTLPLYSTRDTSPVPNPVPRRGLLDPVLDCLARIFATSRKAVAAGVGGFEALDDEYSQMLWSTINAGVQDSGGNYNQSANAADLRAVDQNLLNEEWQVMVPVLQLGPVAGFTPIDLDCNGFALIPRLYDEATNSEIQSSDSARLYVRFNSDRNPWIPFSLGSTANPLQADYTGIARPIRRVWLRVTNITDDPSFPFLIVSFLKNVSLAQGGGAPQIYSVPGGGPQGAGGGGQQGGSAPRGVIPSGGVSGSGGGVGTGGGGDRGGGGGGGRGARR